MPEPRFGLESLSGLEGIGSRRALDDLFSVAYEELRRLAATVKRGDGSVTLSPTALVNEVWLKLAKSPQFRATSPLHFKRIAARAMRQVLVEAARRRRAGKRGHGGAALTIALDGSLVSARPDGLAEAGPAGIAVDLRGRALPGASEPGLTTEDELLALDTALDDLARLEPRQALMVESRFFAGLEVGEIAALLDVSEATVQRDWRAARAWLAHELRRR